MQWNVAGNGLGLESFVGRKRRTRRVGGDGSKDNNTLRSLLMRRVHSSNLNKGPKIQSYRVVNTRGQRTCTQRSLCSKNTEQVKSKLEAREHIGWLKCQVRF